MGLADDGLAGLGTDGVANHASVLTVLHQQHVQVLRRGDGEVLETRGVDELRGAVATVTLVGHRLLALVAATHGGVNTAGLAPAGTDLLEQLALVAGELLRALLDDALGDVGLHHLGSIRNKIGLWFLFCCCKLGQRLSNCKA